MERRADGRVGRIDSTGSGAFSGLEVTWASRSEPDESGRTSPEELIAAAHAACFSMALSFGLANAGTPPEQLNASATVSFQPGEGITAIALAVDGPRPRLDADGVRGGGRGREGELPGLEGARPGSAEITLDAPPADLADLRRVYAGFAAIGWAKAQRASTEGDTVQPTRARVGGPVLVTRPRCSSPSASGLLAGLVALARRGAALALPCGRGDRRLARTAAGGSPLVFKLPVARKFSRCQVDAVRQPGRMDVAMQGRLGHVTADRHRPLGSRPAAAARATRKAGALRSGSPRGRSPSSSGSPLRARSTKQVRVQTRRLPQTARLKCGQAATCRPVTVSCS